MSADHLLILLTFAAGASCLSLYFTALRKGKELISFALVFFALAFLFIATLALAATVSMPG